MYKYLSSFIIVKMLCGHCGRQFQSQIECKMCIYSYFIMVLLLNLCEMECAKLYPDTLHNNWSLGYANHTSHTTTQLKSIRSHPPLFNVYGDRFSVATSFALSHERLA